MNVNHQVTLRIGQLLQVAISFHNGSADQQVQGATGARMLRIRRADQGIKCSVHPRNLNWSSTNQAVSNCKKKLYNLYI